MNINDIEIFEKMGVSKFKRLRKDMNFTQSELAEKLGRKKNYIVTHEQNGIPKDLSLAMSALYILTLKRRFKINEEVLEDSDDIKPTIHNVKINDIIEGICKKREESFKFEIRAIENSFESMVIIYDFDSANMCFTDFSGVKEFTEWLRPIKGTNQAEVLIGEGDDDNIDTEDS